MATKPKLTKKRQTNWKAELTLQTASHSARPQDVPSVVQKDAGNPRRNQEEISYIKKKTSLKTNYCK